MARAPPAVFAARCAHIVVWWQRMCVHTCSRSHGEMVWLLGVRHKSPNAQSSTVVIVVRQTDFVCQDGARVVAAGKVQCHWHTTAVGGTAMAQSVFDVCPHTYIYGAQDVPRSEAMPALPKPCQRCHAVRIPAQNAVTRNPRRHGMRRKPRAPSQARRHALNSSPCMRAHHTFAHTAFVP